MGRGASGAHILDAAVLVEEELDREEELATDLHQWMEEGVAQDFRSKQEDATPKHVSRNQV